MGVVRIGATDQLAPSANAWLHSTGHQHNLQKSQPQASLNKNPLNVIEWCPTGFCFTISRRAAVKKYQR